MSGSVGERRRGKYFRLPAAVRATTAAVMVLIPMDSNDVEVEKLTGPDLGRQFTFHLRSSFRSAVVPRNGGEGQKVQVAECSLPLFANALPVCAVALRPAVAPPAPVVRGPLKSARRACGAYCRHP